MIKHFNIKIQGLVQGVFFRQTAKEIADNLSLKGFCRNESGGRVYCEAEGEEENLERFLEWCQQGPPLAKVEKTSIKEDKMKNFKDFTVG